MLNEYDRNKKYLFVTRGIPGSGKSLFVKDNLSQISEIIESDVIRKDIMGLIYSEDKKDFGVNQSNGKFVWNEIYKKVKEALKTKSVTLDATNIQKWSLNTIINIGNELGVEVIIIDFSKVSLEECLARNALRMPTYKRVPEVVIKRMYNEIQKANEKLYDIKNLYSYEIIKDWLNDTK